MAALVRTAPGHTASAAFRIRAKSSVAILTLTWVVRLGMDCMYLMLNLCDHSEQCYYCYY